MQYGVYSIFRSWWVGRKEELIRCVKRWNIVIAKVGRDLQVGVKKCIFPNAKIIRSR